MLKRVGLLVAAVSGVVSVASAKTLTWKLAVKERGYFADAANWEENAVPEPGDTIVINKTGSAWDKHFLIGASGESFDFGDKGLIFQIDSDYARFMVNFKGSGKVTKTGGGSYGVDCASEHTGGTEVLAGVFQTWGQYAFGTGPIKFIVTNATKPRLGTDAWAVYPKNPVVFTGSGYSGEYSMLESGQEFKFYKFTSDHDGYINAKNVTISFSEDVEMPGKTLSLKFMSGNNNKVPNFTFAANKNIDASIRHLSGGTLTINGICTNAANNLQIESGPCAFGANARWAGTNVVVKGTAQTLSIGGSGNLSQAAVVQLREGAKLALANGILQPVLTLTVDGVELDPGFYDLASAPAVIGGTGTGKLLVLKGNGQEIHYKYWTGPKTGLFSEPSNWSDGLAPVPGDVVEFPALASGYNTLEEEEFDIGAKDLTIIVRENGDWHGLLCNVKFRGSGRIVKMGNGIYSFCQPSYHTGGTLFTDGKLRVDNRGKTPHQFGTGTIVFTAAEGAYPFIQTENWDVGLATPVEFRGDYGGRQAIFCSNPAKIGDVTAHSDIMLNSNYSTLEFTGTVSAVDKTISIKLEPNDVKTPYTPVINIANADASFTVNAKTTTTAVCTFNLKGLAPNPKNTLTVNSGWTVLQATAQWGGTNVVVNGVAGLPTALKLQGAQNLSKDAVVKIDTSKGAKIDIASGVKVQVAALSVNGVAQPEGLYTAAKLPDVITGGGKLRVGNPGVVIILR